MSKSYSWKAENKPMLFSYDLENEYKIIDRWVFDNQRYSRRDLKAEAETLKQLARDFIEIIEIKSISVLHLQNLRFAIINGASGVWEKAVNRLQLLSYYSDDAKTLITSLAIDTDSANAEKGLNGVSNIFTTAEQLEIFENGFKSKSKKVRIKCANVALDLRNSDLIDYLKSEVQNQKDEKVKSAIEFAIDNMWQPSGILTFQS